MKVVIGYPPFDSPKGYAFLGQNRQFQWGHTPWTAYPMVPAYAATLLKNVGYDVYWLDGIWGGQNYQQWEEDLLKIKPDVLMLETKTPVVKKHWKIIERIKNKESRIKVVLVGDHVTALPEESMENSKVDYILTGGNYDFLLLNLCNHLTKGEELEPGIWHRESSKFKVQSSKFESTGHFILNHDLDSLPFIDRDLTKWQLYAYKNSNYARTPGTYTMFGRDCWWGRCTFCLTGESQIVTRDGLLPIKEIVENKEVCCVLTHKGRYRKVTDWHKRQINESISEISLLYLPFDLKITTNHKVYALPKDQLKRCTGKGGGAYWCRPDRISKILDCLNCERKYFSGYKVSLVEVGNLRKGDFLAVPIDRNVKDIRTLDVRRVLQRDPTVLETKHQIPDEQIRQILELNAQGYSQRAITREVGVDRETVNRYILLERGDILEKEIDPLTSVKNGVSFKWGLHKIPSEIPLSEDLLFLAGLYIAEGHVSYSKNRPNSAVLSWTFGKEERELIDKTKVIFEKLFDNQLGDTLNKANNTHQLYIGATVVARFFKNLFGDGSYNKRVPDEFIQLPLEKQRALLRGVFKGDGHLREREDREGGAEYILETTSKRLAEQVFSILLKFDALPSFKVLEPREENESVKYKITLFRKDIPRVFPEIKFGGEKVTYKRGFVLGDFAFVPIVEIKKRSFEGDVYNLTVENDHSYVANFVAVKNCSWTTLYPGKNYRRMSVKRALDEVGHIIDNYPVKEIMDDSGTFPTGDWLKEFCQGMIERGYNKKVRISCNMRFNAGLTREDYQLMGRAGFRFLLYGLESANQKTLDRINKNLQVEQIEPVLRWAKEAGLNPHPTAMVGYPWETKEDALRTLNFVREMFRKGLSDTLQATIVIPYPGTPLFAEAKERGWLKTLDWDRYDMREPILKTEMSDEEIKGLVQGLYKSVLSLQWLWRKTREALTDYDLFKYYLRMVTKFFSKLGDFSKNE